MQTTTRINNKHCDQNYKCLLHPCFDSRHSHHPVFHVALPTTVPGVFSPFPSLPGRLSSRYEGGHPFHPHGTAIFQPAATYMLPHLIDYLYLSHHRASRSCFRTSITSECQVKNGEGSMMHSTQRMHP